MRAISRLKALREARGRRPRRSGEPEVRERGGGMDTGGQSRTRVRIVSLR